LSALVHAPPPFFFLNHTSPTQIYTLSLHDALPILPAHIALEFVAKKGIQKIAVADPVDREHHPLRVDAKDGDAFLARARQDIGFTRKTYERFAIAHKDGELSRFRECLFHDRRKPGTQR